MLPVVKELQDSRVYTFVTNEVQNLREINLHETKKFYEGDFTAQISRACNEYYGEEIFSDPEKDVKMFSKDNNETHDENALKN